MDAARRRPGGARPGVPQADDGETLAVVDPLNHLPTRQAVLAERALLARLGGGCQVPMGAVCRVEGDVLTLRGAVVRPDGSERIEAEGSGAADHPEEIGRQVAEELLARVRGPILVCEEGVRDSVYDSRTGQERFRRE